MINEFLSTIPEIPQFARALDEQSFVPVPDDWVVVIADITDSTQAVADGRYKDVNMIGGAVVCAIQNATTSNDWPFVFGGDGATLVIDAQSVPAAQAALVRTRTLARKRFNLDLRVGFVPVSVIREHGAQLLIARHAVSPGNSFALFGGGGVELAERLVKDVNTANQFVVSDYQLPGLPDLSGLSCRWEPIRSKKGSIVCLLVKPRTENFKKRQAVLSDFLLRLTHALGCTLDEANPINVNSLQFSWPPTGISAETRMTQAKKSYFRRRLEVSISCLIQWCLERFNLGMGHYSGQHYRDEIVTNSDYCKFDDVLRMVLDCELDQLPAVRSLLNQMRSEGTLDYGLFETEQALMTCLLYDLESSNHLHFVDGDDGGLWSASTQLKKQLLKPHEYPSGKHDQIDTMESADVN